MTQQHLHFIGIGGIGMSALAHIYHAQGYTISGCDSATNSQIITDLKNKGCIIAAHHNDTVCFDPSITTYVYSTAISKDSTELLFARHHNIPVLHRSDLLALLCKDKYSIAVSGSHGKTTTTTMITHIFTHANYDPTAVIGGYCNLMKRNYRIGKSNYVIAEADESDRSFLKLDKTIGIITNIDFEHAETYTNMQDLQQTCILFGQQIPDHGHMIVCSDSPAVEQIVPFFKNCLTYGTTLNALYRLSDIILTPAGTKFTLHHQNQIIGNFTLPVIGAHYAYNATAAIIAALQNNIPIPTIQEACATFLGAQRRFTFQGVFLPEEITIIDDYAHHPTEIIATINTAQIVSQNRIIVIFQPHRYTRLQALWDDFITCLSDPRIAHVIVTDVYAASEQPIASITAQNLVFQANKPHITYCPLDEKFENIQTMLKKIIQKKDLVLTIGAGNITYFSKNLK